MFNLDFLTKFATSLSYNNPHFMDTIGKLLKQYRDINKLTLRQVEEKTGISNAYLSQLENDKIAHPSANTLYKLSQTYDVELNGNEAIVNGNAYTFKVAESQADTTSVQKPEADGKAEVITSPMLGMVIKLNVKVGDFVKTGQDLMILEVMKMENPIKSPKDAVVKEILVSKGTQVASGQKLIVLG